MTASRIVIDPEDVRRLATRMRGGASIFSNNGRRLAQVSLPAMPVSIAAHVDQVICEANASLQDLAVELIEDAVHLEARANWAELGGGAEIAWLVPGLRRYPTQPTLPTTLVAEAAAVTEDQIRAGQGWALEALETMHDPGRSLEVDVDDALDENLVDVIEPDAGEIPVRPLGDFTLAAGVGPDVVEHWNQGLNEELPIAGLGAGDGALGSSLRALFLSPTGWGVAGCALAGGLVESGGDDAGDGGLDD